MEKHLVNKRYENQCISNTGLLSVKHAYNIYTQYALIGRHCATYQGSDQKTHTASCL